MKKVLISLLFALLFVTMCSCKKEENSANTAPWALNIQYTFTRELTKIEANQYIQDIESIGTVEKMVSDYQMPIDNFSSNFLFEGTELYLINNQIVAVYDDGETYYAMLLDVSVAS